MRFSVITPSFNQAQFLPHNLRTVSCQTGIDLEHIIVDPGSTDGSRGLARAARHAIVIAEPDRGQSHGITKGFDRSTGEILTWLNSDDMYPSPDTLLKVQQAFEANPSADVIYGNVNFVDTEGKFLRKGFVNKNAGQLLDSFHQQVGIVQPGVFMRRKVFEEVGGPLESYNYCMDYEYWVRIARAGFKWAFVDDVLSHHRWWHGMKTSSGRGDSLIEHFKVCAHHFGYIHWKWLERYAEFRATDEDGVVNHATKVDIGKKAYFEQEAVRRFVTQSMIALLESSTHPEHQATLAYIERHTAGEPRYYFDGSEISISQRTHPDPAADTQPSSYIFDTTSTSGSHYRTYRAPENYERHFAADWFDRQSFRAIDKLQALAERRKEHCVIIGNRPMLSDADLSLLENADVIISDFSVNSDKLRSYATYFTVASDLVAAEGSVDFNRLRLPKIVPFWLSNTINPTDETIFLPATATPRFCASPAGVFSARSTVTFFNMQVAFALGYEQVTLIGVDESCLQTDLPEDGKRAHPAQCEPHSLPGKACQPDDFSIRDTMYQAARDAYNSAGRVLANSSVDGGLEVFPRVPLGSFLGRRGWRGERLPAVSALPLESIFPRLLILDMTAMGNGSATGDLKSNLLDSWPSTQLLQVASLGTDKLGLVRVENGESVQQADTADNISAAIDAFAPDVILYRPVPNVPWLHDFAIKTIKRLEKPLMSWVMDDWPEEIAATDAAQWAKLKPDFLEVINRSSVRLSICEAMSTAFKERYGRAFAALANGVMPHEWPAPRVHRGPSLKVRYAGGLAKNMTRDSVLRISRAVEALARKGHRISFEINTQPWWHKESSELFREFQHTSIETKNRPGAEYRAWLREADVSVIAYNFDRSTARYVQYSQANKMPECLASGSALFAHGPRGLATIDYLAQSDAAVVVSADSDAAVEAALLQLLQDPGRRNALVANGRKLAFSKHNLLKLREEFRSLVASARARLPQHSQPTPSGRNSGDFLAQLALTYDPDAHSSADDAALLLRTFATAVLLEPDLGFMGSELSSIIEMALSTRPETDALRLHVESLTNQATARTEQPIG